MKSFVRGLHRVSHFASVVPIDTANDLLSASYRTNPRVLILLPRPRTALANRPRIVNLVLVRRQLHSKLPKVLRIYLDQHSSSIDASLPIEPGVDSHSQGAGPSSKKDEECATSPVVISSPNQVQPSKDKETKRSVHVTCILSFRTSF